MDVDVDTKGRDDRLNGLVAVTVVVISVFMAVCNIKDDNIGQGMEFAKADSIDLWNEYQAARIKSHIDENDAAILKLHAGAGAVDAQATVAEIARLESKVTKYTKNAADLMARAKADEALHDALNIHDDQFDMSEAFCSITLALAAVAALTELFWLLYVSWGFGAFGLIMGTLGFVGSSFHPDVIANFLS